MTETARGARGDRDDAIHRTDRVSRDPDDALHQRYVSGQITAARSQVARTGGRPGDDHIAAREPRAGRYGV